MGVWGGKGDIGQGVLVLVNFCVNIGIVLWRLLLTGYDEKELLHSSY
jgi:hypothetical protein